MQMKWGYALPGGLTVGIAIVLVACGRLDDAQVPPAVSQASLPTQIVNSAAEARSPTPMPRVLATEDLSEVPPQPAPTALDAPATQTRPPRGFADVAPPVRTPLPPVAGTCTGGCDVPPQGCLIKGTLPRPDYKVFLLPGQPGYDAAEIDTQKGERWFCTIDEARAAGWVRSKVPLPAHAPAP